MSDLPSGWEWATVGDLVEVLDNLRVPVSAKERSTRTGNVPYYGATGQVGWIDSMLFNEPLLLLGEDGAPFLESTKRKAYRINGPAWVNNHAHVLRPYEGLSIHFLELALNSVDYRAYVTGTTRLKLTKAALLKIQLQLPPLAEQERICAIVDDLLPLVENGIRYIDSAEARCNAALIRTRDSVVERARVDRSSIPLSEAVSHSLRNGYSGRATAAPGGVRTLTLSAVTKNDFTDENTKMADVVGKRIDDLWLRRGDILVQRSNTPELVGTSAVFDGAEQWAIYPDLLIRVRVNDDYDPRFVQAVLASSSVRSELRRSAKGLAGNMPKIDQGALGRVRIPKIPLRQQRELAAEIDVVLQQTATLLERCRAAKSRATAMRSRITENATRGKLGTGDAGDVPASVLLDRIEEERTAVSSGVRRRARAVTPRR